MIYNKPRLQTKSNFKIHNIHRNINKRFIPKTLAFNKIGFPKNLLVFLYIYQVSTL